MNNYEILAERSKKVIYKDGDTVLKVFDSDYSKVDVLNEALNQARIEETGLNVPKLLEVSKIDGKWAIRIEYIPGKTLKQLMEENPDRIDEYLKLFVSIQKEIRLDSMKDHKKICHGDFTPSNIIITPGEDHYIIDWSHVTQGNAAADAARTYMLFCLKGEDKIAEKYLNLFCSETDTAKQYVQRWMPIVACTQSIKGKASEQELLERWVNVVEYE